MSYDLDFSKQTEIQKNKTIASLMASIFSNAATRLRILLASLAFTYAGARDMAESTNNMRLQEGNMRSFAALIIYHMHTCTPFYFFHRTQR